MTGRGVALVVLCVGAGAALGYALATARVPAPAAGVELLLPLSRMHEELVGLRADLAAARQAGPAPVGSAPAAEPQPLVTQTLASLERAVAALEAATTTLLAAVEGSDAPSASRAVAPNTEALRALNATVVGGEPRIDPELFGLSPLQVRRRLGTPTWVGLSSDGVHWEYYTADGQSRLLTVNFIDGYVVSIQP